MLICRRLCLKLIKRARSLLIKLFYIRVGDYTTTLIYRDSSATQAIYIGPTLLQGTEVNLRKLGCFLTICFYRIRNLEQARHLNYSARSLTGPIYSLRGS